MMTNEEKKQYIIENNNLYFDNNIYKVSKNTYSNSKIISRFIKEFYTRNIDKIPHSLYKYREPSKRSIENLRDDVAWFSKPYVFDDTLDSTINNNVEAEFERFEENPAPIIRKLSIAFLQNFGLSYGIKVDLSNIDEQIGLFNGNGELDIEKTRIYMKDKLPKVALDNLIKQMKKRTGTIVNAEMKKSIKNIFNYYLKMGDRIRKVSYVFSLSEDSDIQAMWGLYAKKSKGFCIEYSFLDDEYRNDKVIFNLYPIVYGQRPDISILNIILRAMSLNEKKIAGISINDYIDWILSLNTKDPSYSFQKEWRVCFTEEMGGNKQKFPFVKSIILGERISKNNANKLIEIAKDKQINVYRRVFSKTGSDIIVEKVL